MDARQVHAIHEAAHALVAHACGLRIHSVRIDEGAQSGADIDRGYDPATADQEVGGNASAERIRELLPRLNQDLAVCIAGVVAEQIRGVYVSGDPENRVDEENAERLVSRITLGQWKITPDRPRFSDREKPDAYRSRMQSAVERVLREHERALEAFARELEGSTSVSGEDAQRILEEHGVKLGSFEIS